MRIINPLINPIKWQTSYTTGDSFKSCLDRGLSDHVEQLVERSIWRIDQVLVGLLATILGWWTPYWVKRVLFVALYKNALYIYIYIRIKMRVELFAMIRHFAAPLETPATPIQWDWLKYILQKIIEYGMIPPLRTSETLRNLREAHPETLRLVQIHPNLGIWGTLGFNLLESYPRLRLYWFWCGKRNQKT